MSALAVAVIQLRTPADPHTALAQASPLIRQAAAGGATLIATPEGTNLLQRDRAALRPLLATASDDVCVTGLRALAEELGVHLLIGSALLLSGDGAVVNRTLLVDPRGAIIDTYDKMHMFDVDLPNGERARESEAYRPGDRAVVADMPGARLGLTICYDLRFPYLFRALAQAGAEILTVPAAFTRSTGEAHWEILRRARAIETGSFVIAPAQGGRHEDGRATWGRSMIVGPWGEVIAASESDEPGVIAARLDLAAVARARQAIPALANARAFSGPGAAA